MLIEQKILFWRQYFGDKIERENAIFSSRNETKRCSYCACHSSWLMRNDGECEQYTVGIKLLSPGDTYTTRIIVEYYSGRYSIPVKDLDVVRPRGKGFINQLVQITNQQRSHLYETPSHPRVLLNPDLAK